MAYPSCSQTQIKNERGDCWVCEFLRRGVDEKKIDVQFQSESSVYSICVVYSPEPCAEDYCFRLNFSVSKLAYQYF